MKRKVVQVMAFFAAFCMAFFQLTPGLTEIARATAKTTEKVEKDSKKNPEDFQESEEENISKIRKQEDGKERYLIQTKTKAKFSQVQEHCEQELAIDVESSEDLGQEQIMVATLTTGEAITIDTMSGVTVEKDEVVNGATEDLSEKEKEEYIEAVEETVKGAWDIKAVHAEETEDIKDTIKVAVLDSGYDKTGDIACKEIYNLVDPEENVNGDDYSGHGTAVTSIIASGSQDRGTQGIIEDESKIELYTVKVLDGDNQAPISRVIEGIQWCIENEISIINMSFGTTYYSTILEDAIQRAEEAGILMIASVGNNGETVNQVEYPAAFEEVVGVGSVNEKMEHSVFSATGEEVELVAPGENIPLSSYWGLVSVGSGTSYAAPHVTGIAALLWAKDSQKSSDSIRGLLQKSARKLGENEKFGYGLVDYEYASEIYEEYMEVYQEEEGVVQEESRIEENEAVIQEYDVPEVVQGSWADKYHYDQVQTIGGKSYKNTIYYVKAGSIAPDWAVYKETGEDETSYIINLSTSSYANPDFHYDVLHARRKTNYVAAVKCLLNAAIIIKTEGNNSTARGNAQQYFRDNYADSFQTRDECWDDIFALDDALEVACFFELKLDKNDEAVYVADGVSAEQASHQLLGMAIHVATDAYAHRTVIPSDVAEGTEEYSYENGAFQYYNISGYIKDFEDLMYNIFHQKLTTSGVRDYAKESGCIKPLHKGIADKTEFLPLRYNQGSYMAIAELLFLFGSPARKEEMPYVFCPYLLYIEHGFTEKYNLGLDKLMKNIKDAGYDIANYTLVTVSEWQSLSK